MALATFIWEPYFSPLPLLALAIVLGGLAVVAYARTWSQRPVLSVALLVMRLVVLAALFALLMGPSHMPEQDEIPERGTLRIVVDTSASMQHADMHGQTRYDYIRGRWLTDARLDALERDYDLEIIGFDESVYPLGRDALHRPAATAATGRATHVVESLQRILDTIDAGAESDGASLIVFSDGRDSNDASPLPVAQQARSRSIPIHTVPVGGPNLQRDLAVVAMPQQGYLLAGERGAVEVDIYQTNAPDVATTLRLRGGDELIERPIRFERRSRVSVTLPIERDEPGLHEFEVEIEPVDGEIELRNNRQRFFVEVTGEPLEVLVLEGEPYWDTRFLAQSLRKDEHIALTQVIQVSMGRQARIISGADEAGDNADRRLPETLEDFAAYDVIVLGRGLENVLEPAVAELLVDYVSDHGGRVIFSRGRAYDASTSAGRAIGRALSVLEPVVWGQGSRRDYQVVLEGAGREHPSFAHAAGVAEQPIDEVIARMPLLESLPTVARAKSSARVLARARPTGVGGDAGQPVLLSMPYGRGRVVALAGQGLWRWSLHEHEPTDAAGVFDRFWSNMIRYLAMGGDFQPGREITLRVDRPAVRLGEPVELEVRSRQPIPPHASPTLRVGPSPADASASEPPTDTDAGLWTHQLATGAGHTRQRVTFEPEATGVYEAVVDAGELTPEPVVARFTVYDVDEERLRSAADPRLMRLLAEHSGGRLLDPAEPDEMLDVLREHRAAQIVPPRPETIWDKGWILTLLLLWLGAEWILRRKGGLL